MKTYKPSDDRFYCMDKEWGHRSVYLKDVFTVNFECDYHDNDGFLTKWVLRGKKYYRKGTKVSEFIDTLKDLIEKYDLDYYTNKKSQYRNGFYRDQVLIYTDNASKVYGFTQKYATNVFKNKELVQNFILLDFFVVCDANCWIYDKEEDIQKRMEDVMDKIFIPEKRVYTTPHQRSRKLDKKSKCKCIFPEDIVEFNYWYSAYYGGVSYFKNMGIYNDLIEYDRKSAYLYEYFMPHMSSPLKEANTKLWEELIISNTHTIGTYKIKFKMKHKFINVYKKKGEYNFLEEFEETFTFLSIDLKMFLQCVELIDIECLSLFEYEVADLPEYYIKHIVNDFVNKEVNHNTLYKTIANANYGNLTRKLTNEKVRELKNDNPYYCPMWGFEITAYARQHLFEVGKKLEGWVYSDTDSIYCLNNSNNIKIIEDYNNYMQDVIRIACNKFNLNFDQVCKLGLFIKKNEIKSMVVRSLKTYAYITDDDKFVTKASGCTGYNSKETWFDLSKKLDNGKRISKGFTDHSYYEVPISNVDILNPILDYDDVLDQLYSLLI